MASIPDPFPGRTSPVVVSEIAAAARTVPSSVRWHITQPTGRLHGHAFRTSGDHGFWLIPVGHARTFVRWALARAEAGARPGRRPGPAPDRPAPDDNNGIRR